MSRTELQAVFHQMPYQKLSRYCSTFQKCALEVSILNRIISTRHLKDLNQTVGRKVLPVQTGPGSQPPREHGVHLGSPFFVELAQSREGREGGVSVP